MSASPDLDARFRRAFPPVADALRQFADEAATRFGDSVALSLRFLESGDGSVRVMVVLTDRSRSRTGSTLVWSGDALFTNHRSRIVRLNANSRDGSIAAAFQHVMRDQLALALDTLRDAA